MRSARSSSLAWTPTRRTRSARLRARSPNPVSGSTTSLTPVTRACWDSLRPSPTERPYVAWRDAGMVIVDVSDRANPSIISRFDYVPPFHGGALGATHTAAPVITAEDKQPTLVVLTDEIIACPPGYGRIVDISDLSNPVMISTLRIPHVTDNFDPARGSFSCATNGHYIHHPWFDARSPSLLYVAWIEEGVRVW